jgi:SAM-dependent methyltransferase
VLHVSRRREGLRVTTLSVVAERVWGSATERNQQNIRELVRGLGGTLVDFGCGDGVITASISEAGCFSRTIGLEIDEEVGRLAAGQGVEVVAADLNEGVPLPDATADAIVANQIIEHLKDTDKFLEEIKRALKPGGVAALSTENISSWHNILAALLGWQPFSLTNISSRSSGVGNPVALHRGESGTPVFMQHLRIFAPRGLKELVSLHGLEPIALKGAGYFPFYGRAAEALSQADPRHSVFMTLLARKPR